jgi:CLIP-associating protein 1/2
LSGAAIDVINALALGLSTSFEPLMSLFLPALILLCGRANKVVVARAKACILAIIGTTQLPGILLHLAHFVKDKTPTIRLLVAEGTLRCLKCLNPPDLEKEVYVREVENIMRNAARDANADVRRVGKEIFENYKVLLPHKVNRYVCSNSSIAIHSVYQLYCSSDSHYTEVLATWSQTSSSAKQSPCYDAPER